MYRSCFGFVLVCLASSAAAQSQITTKNCQFILGTMQCTSTTPQQPQGINWGLLNQPQPNYSGNALSGFEQGRRMVEDAQRMQMLREQGARDQAAAEQQSLLVAQEQTASAEQARIMAEGIALARTQSIEAGKLVAAGDCEAAQRYALQEGNFILAQQVKEYCGK